MYYNNTRALLMTNDSEFQENMQNYLFNRYNLIIDTAADSLEVLERFGSTGEPYEMIILDEDIDGLPTASHVFKSIKKQDEQTCVMFRSTLKELTEPYSRTEIALPPQYADRDFRLGEALRRIDTLNTLIYPIINSKNMEEVYQNVCEGLAKVFKVDYAVVAITRSDQKPIKQANLVWNIPGRIKELPLEFNIEGSAYLENLVKYYKPIYIPNIDVGEKHKNPFLQDIKERFSYSFRSALLAPLVFNSATIGLFGLFTEKEGRFYNLVDLDTLLKVADFGAIAIIAAFLKEHKEMEIKIPKLRDALQFPELSGTLF
jgi:hypothetical protein